MILWFLLLLVWDTVKVDAFLVSSSTTTRNDIISHRTKRNRDSSSSSIFLFPGPFREEPKKINSNSNIFASSAISPRRCINHNKKSSTNNKVPSQVWNDLFFNVFKLPYQCSLEDNTRRMMELRLLKLSDIPKITQLCYEEYGNYGRITTKTSMFATTATASKFKDPVTIIKAVLDDVGDFFLQPFVQAALFSKWFLSHIRTGAGDGGVPKDHVLLVLTLSDDLVGWVDLSRQVVRPDRNPSFFPWPKSFIGGGFWRQPPPQTQAWITNLLIAPQFRGQGWSKVLMGACEAVTRSHWKDVSSIHLHCDADPITGYVPQQLYLSLGYEPDTSSGSTLSSDDQFSWMTTVATQQHVQCFSSIYVIDGVPLLYLRKNL